jgi:hypothetical protein
MATITPSWTENVEYHASASLAAGASATDDIDLDNASYDAVQVTVEIVFGGTTDGDVDVEILLSSDSGTTDDTEASIKYTIPATDSATKSRSVTVKDTPYIAIKVTNNDSTDNVTYHGWYAGRQWSSV